MWAMYAGVKPVYDSKIDGSCGDDCDWVFQAVKDKGYTTLYSGMFNWMAPLSHEACSRNDSHTPEFYNECRLFEPMDEQMEAKAGRVKDRIDHIFNYPRHICGGMLPNCPLNEYGMFATPFTGLPEHACIVRVRHLRS